ncbi:hypothetical protein NE857_03455 [Nocardiopsis exhalans]|uniref:Uncharacterized protein n=1 Tax=Nocardiopsis exhalans TaxID=163604 RepID=A0ABY5DC79_9ACTN|nr:hypothetical protein [Nocardiopsis exhalans]USY20727.1 hypothetical protein NE857_03455 [Nocardiopsis exhalans]
MTAHWPQHTITVPMLTHLHEGGPGTLITAQGGMAPYRVQRPGEVDLNTPWLIIAYGHGDLRLDLIEHDDWDRVAARATRTAAKAHHRLFFQPPPPLARAVRRDLTRHGLVLDHRPEASRTEDDGYRWDDHLTWADNPRLTFTMTYIQRHRDSLLINLAMYDRDRYVTSWPERITTTSGVPFCVREAPDRARRRLELYP